MIAGAGEPGIPTCAKVQLRNVYPGIDFLY